MSSKIETGNYIKMDITKSVLSDEYDRGMNILGWSAGILLVILVGLLVILGTINGSKIHHYPPVKIGKHTYKCIKHDTGICTEYKIQQEDEK